jgi:hypothetical protein
LQAAVVVKLKASVATEVVAVEQVVLLIILPNQSRHLHKQ